jgi:hypothetical protein
VPEDPYRAPLPVPPDPYLVAWREVQRRKRASKVGALLCLVWMSGLLFAGVVWNVLLPLSSAAWIVPAFIVFVALGRWVSGVSCPHCGAEGVWNKKAACEGCGIKIGTPKAAVDEAEKQLASGPLESLRQLRLPRREMPASEHPGMDFLTRCLHTFGVLVGVLLACGIIALWSQRISLLYLAIPAALALAIAYWCRVQAQPLAAAFFALAVTCAVSPVDLEFRTMADAGIQVLPYSYGYRCVPGTLCRGCVVPRHAAQYAMVVSPPW